MWNKRPRESKKSKRERKEKSNKNKGLVRTTKGKKTLYDNDPDAKKQSFGFDKSQVLPLHWQVKSMIALAFVIPKQSHWSTFSPLSVPAFPCPALPSQFQRQSLSIIYSTLIHPLHNHVCMLASNSHSGISLFHFLFSVKLRIWHRIFEITIFRKLFSSIVDGSPAANFGKY